MFTSAKNHRSNSLRAVLPDAIVTFLVLAITCSFAAAGAKNTRQNSAQQVGSLDASVRVTATGGESEPARGITLFLLRKSFEDVRKEANAAEPALDMNAFIDNLEVSPGLKAWMKKHQMVELSGPEFPKALTADDIFDIKEFTEAFGSRINGDISIDLPTAKYLKVNRQKNPEKYQQLLDEYNKQLRAVIALHPDLLDSLYMALEQNNVNPGPTWSKLSMERTERVRRRGLALAQSQYLVTTATTDLDGRCTFGSVPAGNYWVTTLDVQAMAGDAHLRWDLPVVVPPGQSATVQLSSVNGLVPGQ